MSSQLTERQRGELNLSILEYLISQGDKYAATIENFKQESNITPEQLASMEVGKGLLEKKWTSVIRLQKRIFELETKIESQKSMTGSMGLYANDGSATNEVLNGKIGGELRLLPKAPPKHTLSGHRAPITCVLCHPVYSLVVTASEDATMKVWDHELGQYEFTLKGHTGSVTCIAFDPKGNILASCSADMSAKLWDFRSKSCVKTLKGHEHSLSGVTFLPTGDHLLTCSRDETIKYWEVTTGFCLKTYTGHTDWVKCVAVSLDGLYMASAGCDQSIIIWTISSGQKIQTLVGHDHVIETLGYGKKPLDTSLVLAASSAESLAKLKASANDYSYLASGSRDRTIKLWDPLRGVCLATFTAHENWVRSLFIHPTGKYIISSSDDKTIRVHDIKENRCIRTITDAHTHFVSTVALSQNFPIVVSGSVDQMLSVWHCS
eukprot:gene6659-9140_t